MTVIISQCSAHILTEDAKLTASDAAAGDGFGVSVAVSGETIVIGAAADDDTGTDSGSAYVYVPDGEGGWTETKLTASDAAADDWFGMSVAVSGETIVIGSPGDDDAGTMSGSAYVYVPDGEGGWTETKLTASDAAYFGRSVAVSGETIVIGAPSSLSAYVYVPDGEGGWTETKLTAAADNRFGRSVAVSGDTIVIGAEFDDDAGTNSGSAYVYLPDGEGGWTGTKLTASDAAGYDHFGGSVAVCGETIVIGAPSSDSAYVYVPDGEGGWTETKITASDVAAGDRFGFSVAVSGDTIVIGGADYAGDSDSAYVYVPDGEGGWTETKLIASDAAAGDWFGLSVAVSGDTIVIGAYEDDDACTDSGSAYVYLNKPPVAEAGGPYNVDEGNSITLDGTGSIDPDGDPLTYEWDLDNDGEYDDATGEFVTHTYYVKGVYTVGLRVTDTFGVTDTDTTTVTVSSLIPAIVDVKPDTLNKASQGGLVTAYIYIELPGYDVNEIDVSTVTLSTNNGKVSALLSPTQVGDYDNDGIPDRMVKFDRQAIIGIVDIGDIVVTISGKIAGEIFEGSDEIHVIGSSEQIPEFPTVAIPVISLIGLMFLFQRRQSR